MAFRWRRAAQYVPCAAFCVVALWRATTPAPPSSADAATEQVRRAIFAEVARQEPSMRAEAAHQFPGDAWSQDDDFHQREQKEARNAANRYHVRLGDALRALDDGLRDRWPLPAGVVMRPGVPPCRPRLTY
jgi:hypothetical protein